MAGCRDAADADDRESRQRRVDLNYAGMQEREDRIAQQIADIEERNLRSMTRLIERGQKAEREFAKLDPAKKVEKIAALRTQFADVAARSEKAADSLAERAKAVAAEEIAALQRQINERKIRQIPVRTPNRETVCVAGGG